MNAEQSFKIALPCPVCLGWPETPQTVNVGRTGYEPVLITCSHPCHGVPS